MADCQHVWWLVISQIKQFELRYLAARVWSMNSCTKEELSNDSHVYRNIDHIKTSKQVNMMSDL
jgi:hypothetical protein